MPTNEFTRLQNLRHSVVSMAATRQCPLLIVDASALAPDIFYEDHVQASVPLIVRDVQLLRLKPKWSDAFLEARAALHVHDEVRLSSGVSDTSFPLTKVAGERSASLTVRDFLGSYRRPNRTANYYATNLILPHLADDYPKPFFTELLDHGCASGWCGGLWLGAGTQRSSLHRDFSENVHGVIEGTKTFTLFPPNETAALYPRPETANRLGHTTRMPSGARACGGLQRRQPHACGSDENASAGHSGDAVECPRDFDRFGGALERAFACSVHEGEMLFLPSGWWHEVDTEGGATSSAGRGNGDDALGRSLSINFWFRAEWPRETLRLAEREVEDLERPLRAPALRQLGLDLAQRGRAADASALLQRSLELEPDQEVAAVLQTLRARFGGLL
eukprot:1285796-Prymnesium_polylepis.1